MNEDLAENTRSGWKAGPVTKSKDPRYSMTPKTLEFIKGMSKGMNQTSAAKAAGYAQPSVAACQLMRKEKVRLALAIERANYVRATGMTKRQVMNGFIEAIGMAKLKADPLAMISGWREVAKMCGFYEPVKHKLDIDVRGHVIVQKLQSMSDADLLKLAEGDGSVIDAEFSTVEDNQPALPALVAPTLGGGEDDEYA